MKITVDKAVIEQALGALSSDRVHLQLKAKVALRQAIEQTTEQSRQWADYLKEGETPFERFLRERQDLEALLKMYRKEVAENEQLKAEQAQLEQILTDPENQPNQYGVEFLMRGNKMAFKVGVQQFTLDYEPTEPGEFEFMRSMLIRAFSTFTRDETGQQAEHAQPVAAPPCPDCAGTGVDGDVGSDGRVVDVACSGCAGSGVARFRGKCPNGRRCLHGCFPEESCYHQRYTTPPPRQPLADEAKDAARYRFLKRKDADWWSIEQRATDLKFEGGLDEAVDEAMAAHSITGEKK